MGYFGGQGRPLGDFVFSLSGRKRISFTSMFQGLERANLGSIERSFRLWGFKGFRMVSGLACCVFVFSKTEL